MNYFNYFTEIEDTFIRRWGKHLLISPMDWALIETWKERNVPLHVALRGIEKSFDSWESKPRKRTIKSLLYCQEEVEAQFAEWLDSRLGAGEPDEESDAQKGSASSPFSREAILQHLRSGRVSLLNVQGKRSSIEDDFSDAVRRTTQLLTSLEEELEGAITVDAKKLEESLTGLERLLSHAIRSVAPTEKLQGIETEVKEQLKPYRKQMEADVYQQTFDNLTMKRLREDFEVPRLSLFYL